MLMPLLRAMAAGDWARASRLLAASPQLARASTPVGASRGVSAPYYFKEIERYVYAGDTALHIAAAAYRVDIAEELVANGANPSARNRRGAEPLQTIGNIRAVLGLAERPFSAPPRPFLGPSPSRQRISPISRPYRW